MQSDPTRTRILRDEYARELKKLPVRARKRVLSILENSELNDDIIPKIQAVIEEEMGEKAARPIIARLTKIAWMRGADFAMRKLKATGVEIMIPQYMALLDDETIRTLENLSLDYVKKLSEEVKGKISAEIRQGILKGESPRKIAERIRDIEKMSKNRADMIARTESIRVFNKAAEERYRAAGVKKWKWLAAADERTCSICFPRDGKIYRMGDELPPIHPHCRCTQAPVIREREVSEKKQNIEKIIIEKEAAIRDKKIEYGYLFDDSGNLILKKSGGKDYISFTDDELKLFKGKRFTHNHPRGTSFSPDDISFACRGELKEIRATGRYGTFVMRTKEGTFNESLWEKINPQQKHHNSEVRAEFYTKIEKGEMTVDTANKKLWHEVWSRVAKDISEIDYKLIKHR